MGEEEKAAVHCLRRALAETAAREVLGHPSEGWLGPPAVAHFPLAAPIWQVAAAFPDRSALLVVGCVKGIKGAAACELLRQEGYTAVHNMAGGFEGWSAAGLPVARPAPM